MLAEFKKPLDKRARRHEMILALALVLIYGIGDLGITFYISTTHGFADELNPLATLGAFTFPAMIALKLLALAVILFGQGVIRRVSNRGANSLMLCVILFASYIFIKNVGYIVGTNI